MSRQRNPFPHYALGKGRLWDGISLTPEIISLFWWDRDYTNGVGNPLRVPRTEVPPSHFYEMAFVDWEDEDGFCVISDHGEWHLISQESAQVVLAWLNGQGYSTRSLKQMRESDEKVVRQLPKRPRVKRSQLPRDEFGKPTLESQVRRCLPSGQLKRLARQLTGDKRLRTRQRNAARAFQDDYPE
jgi:hypothetical protein